MPKRPCIERRCPNHAEYRGRCKAHARARERATHVNKSFYNSKRWQMTRRRQLTDYPLCRCGQIATDVDHILPIEEGGAKWSEANLQSLCALCHGTKTRREQA